MGALELGTDRQGHQFTSVVYGDGQFVASGDRWTYQSTDGVNWQALGQPIRQVAGLAYANGRFVAVVAGGTAHRTGGRP